MDEQQQMAAQIFTRCTQGLRDTLEDLATKDHRPLSNYIRKVLEEHVREATTEKSEEAKAAA